MLIHPIPILLTTTLLVALSFNNGQGIVIVSLESAQQEYEMLLATPEESRTEMQHKRFAALTLALGTVHKQKKQYCEGNRCTTISACGKRLPAGQN